MTIEGLREMIRDIPDFPEPGVVFKDITPVLAHGEALSRLIDHLVEPFAEAGITKVAGIESRGFILATPMADRLGAGFVPIRKPGKLPSEVVRREYTLEYGTDALEIHVDAIEDHDRVLLVDDVIATGGTAAAAVQLLAEVGADVLGMSVFVELLFLEGRQHLNGLPLHSLIAYGD